MHKIDSTTYTRIHEFQRRYYDSLNLSLQERLSGYLMAALGATSTMTSVGIVMQGSYEQNPYKIAGGMAMCIAGVLGGGWIYGKKEAQAYVEAAQSPAGQQLFHDMVLEEFGVNISSD